VEGGCRLASARGRIAMTGCKFSFLIGDVSLDHLQSVTRSRFFTRDCGADRSPIPLRAWPRSRFFLNFDSTIL